MRKLLQFGVNQKRYVNLLKVTLITLPKKLKLFIESEIPNKNQNSHIL